MISRIIHKTKGLSQAIGLIVSLLTALVLSFGLHQSILPTFVADLRIQQSQWDKSRGEIMLSAVDQTVLNSRLVFNHPVKAVVWDSGFKIGAINEGHEVVITDTLYSGKEIVVEFKTSKPFRVEDLDVLFTGFQIKGTTLKEQKRRAAIVDLISKAAIITIIVFQSVIIVYLIVANRKICGNIKQEYIRIKSTYKKEDPIKNELVRIFENLLCE